MTQEPEKQRTLRQNAALHKFFELLADRLNAAGLDQRAVLKPSIQIPWNASAIKEQIWKPIQDLQLGKKSTTELTTSEVSAVYETLNRFLAEKHGVSQEFPSDQSMLENLQIHE
jgi:hypothetical protein